MTPVERALDIEVNSAGFICNRVFSFVGWEGIQIGTVFVVVVDRFIPLTFTRFRSKMQPAREIPAWFGKCGSCGTPSQFNYDPKYQIIEVGYVSGVYFEDQLYVELNPFCKDHKGQAAVSKFSHYALVILFKL